MARDMPVIWVRRQAKFLIFRNEWPAWPVDDINPVKHALVPRARDWPHSSFHHDVRAGIFPEDGAGDVQDAGEFGER
jgi:putative transposase